MKAALDKSTKASPKAGNTTAPAGANAVVNPGEVKEAQKVAESQETSDNSTSSAGTEKSSQNSTSLNVTNGSNSTQTNNQSTLSQIIDEVQLEQEAAPAPLKPVNENEFQGFIGKYTKKVEEKNNPQQ